jgi:hypothetical protein
MLYTIPLSLALQFEKLAAMRGVSAVARGEIPSSQTQGGFFQAAKRVRGSIRRLSKLPISPRSTQTWWQRRNAFCERHSAQQSLHHEPLVETKGKYKGTPTRRQLGLIMWMGSNLSPSQLRSMLPQVKQSLKK